MAWSLRKNTARKCDPKKLRKDADWRKTKVVMVMGKSEKIILLQICKTASDSKRFFYLLIMKKIFKYLFGFVLFISMNIHAQVIINPEAGNPGPKGQTEARFYYIPDIEVYYDIQKSNYIYLNGTHWEYSDVLPVRYAYYDLNSGYKVMLYDYSGEKPQSLFKTHRAKYPKGYKGPPSEASPKGKIKEEGKPAEDLFNIKNKIRKKKKLPIKKNF